MCIIGRVPMAPTGVSDGALPGFDEVLGLTGRLLFEGLLVGRGAGFVGCHGAAGFEW